jgi:hypothetical protein
MGMLARNAQVPRHCPTAGGSTTETYFGVSHDSPSPAILRLGSDRAQFKHVAVNRFSWDFEAAAIDAVAVNLIP